jgi:carbamoyl-phosphate synthase large subunit
MGKRTDIKKILIIGSGPITIGQACEFDYSGSQACKALREEGYEIILINSNPATIMTDPEMADRTYLEPPIPEIAEKIIEKEKPDVLLPTLGGQTALNLTIQLAELNILKKNNVEIIGASYNAIKKAEDRQIFKQIIKKTGLKVPESGIAKNYREAEITAKKIGFPVIIRPAYTMGGTGGSIAYNIEEFKNLAENGLKSSMANEILIEQSVAGWKEFELEVMRDIKDNVVIICSIENFDPMGVHTGDSITVAPIQTLTDCQYQDMRDASIKIIREIGVETGGSNIQFAVNPKNGEMVVVEMNPRVSRSSALASKATGFPIAKIAAKLAVGYTLDEIPNDITRKTPACFEPAIDYCVVKIPKFDFEKFPSTDTFLTTSMKSVGEVMAIGRTFKESLQKALRSLEESFSGLENCLLRLDQREGIKKPNPLRLFYIKNAIKKGLCIEKINKLSGIDRWFLANIQDIVTLEKEIIKYKNRLLPVKVLKKAKEFGFSDRQLAKLTGKTEIEIRNIREKYSINAGYKIVDTCAGEFEAYTPYYYSTYG